MKPDYSLYLVTDRNLSRGRATLEIVKPAVAGGVTVIQLREKQAPGREFFSEALALRQFCREQQVLFIINDRLDIAQAVEADGVHLGQEDLPLQSARQILGTAKIIGISAFDERQAGEAEQAGADYIGVSPIFTTPTKPELKQGLGLEGLRRIRAAVRLPLVAIGGLGPDNAYEVIKAGADGIAVVSAIISAEDPRQAASLIKAEINRARGEQA